MPGILVGVDGSEHSRRALEWAMHEAASHHVPLTLISVYPAPIRPAAEVLWALPELPDKSLDPELARMGVLQFAEKVANETGEAVPEVSVIVVTGDPAEELIKASSDADMLVVGSRGNGGFARLLLGSVSSKVMHHAACPVTVVPERR
jgi:nucleotide-binding universal stress UspA family protein